MKLIQDEGQNLPVLELTERNLRALLGKLLLPSRRTLIDPDHKIAVRAVHNVEHYGDRAPGPVGVPVEDQTRIQMAIEDAARSFGEEAFYAPSPGQTWSHVAYRITRAVVDYMEGRNSDGDS